jgi:hypothetical protein
VNITPCGLGHRYNGLPSHQTTTTFQCDQGLYSPWQMVTPNASFSECQSAPQLVLPTGGNFANLSTAQHHDLDSGMTWNQFSSGVPTNVAQSWDGHGIPEGSLPSWESHGLEPSIPEGDLQPLWAGQIHNSRWSTDAVDGHTYVNMGSDSTITDSDDGYVVVAPEPFADADTFVDDVPTFMPLPQEVLFEREHSPLPKQESDCEETPLLTRSIYVSPTGGKTIKKGTASVSKKRSRRSRSRGSKRRGSSDRDRLGVIGILKEEDVEDDEDFFGTQVKLAQEDGYIYRDEKTGKWRKTIPSEPKKQCGFKDNRGVRCTKMFQRIEHLKRHERTHDPRKDHICKIPECKRAFDRHDNLQAHMVTHLRLPNKKQRNPPCSLAQLYQYCTDPITGPKLKEKLNQKWLTEVGDLSLAFAGEVEERVDGLCMAEVMA